MTSSHNGLLGNSTYELLVSSGISFTNPIIIKIGDYILPTTAWQSDIRLDFDTTYYWKVRATSSNTYSAWSAAGAFTTESSPAELSSPAALLPPAEPSSLTQPLPPVEPLPPASPLAFPDQVMWLIYLGGALLLLTLGVFITVIVLTVRMGRL